MIRPQLVTLPNDDPLVWMLVDGRSIRTYVRHRSVVLIAWFAATLFAFLILATDFVIAGTRQFSWGSYPRAGAGGALFLIYFAVVPLGITLSALRAAGERVYPLFSCAAPPNCRG